MSRMRLNQFLIYYHYDRRSTEALKQVAKFRCHQFRYNQKVETLTRIHLTNDKGWHLHHLYTYDHKNWKVEISGGHY